MLGDSRTAQKLLSFGDLLTTMTCLHLFKVSAGDLVSPLDTVALADGVTGLWAMRDRLQGVGTTSPGDREAVGAAAPAGLSRG